MTALALLASPSPRKIVVGINRDFAPYEYLDAGGHPAGYDVDLLRALASVEHLELEFRANSWDRSYEAFRDGRLDMMAGLLYSKSRDEFAEFSMPHLVVHYSLFVRNADGALANEADLRGHRVLVERQSQMHEHLLNSDLGFTLIPVASEPEALRRLAAGEAEAAAAPQLLGLVLAKRERLPIRQVGGPLMIRNLCFAVQEGNSDLVSRLNTGLAILNQTGAYAEIYQRWFGNLQSDAGPGRAVLHWVLVVLALVGGALLITGGWIWILRRKVAQATERIRIAHLEIHDREAFLHSVIENLPVAIFGKDPRRNFEFSLWNARSEQVFGLTKEQVLGRNDYDFFPKHQADFFRLKDEEVVLHGQPLDIPDETIHSRTLGDISLHTRKVPLFDEAGKPILLLGISENTTERRRMEEAMRQAQKLESLGILAGGIAHDFNNLLTAILGNLGIATLQLPEGHGVQGYLRKAEATALRASELTRQMLDYTGRGVFLMQPTDLNQVSREMASLLQVSISKKVELSFLFGEELPPILADPAQLQQVVMNLIINASDAIGEANGVIQLSTGLANLDAAQIAALHQAAPLLPGRYATLCVQDSGCGMAPEVLARIFDPFFTTKFTGRGLGLSAMLGILRAHKGGIQIHSEPGRGSRFCLYFPLAEQASKIGAAPTSPERSFGRFGTILLVDDEPEIRQSTSSLLRQLGFQVLEAADGQEALDLFRAHPGSIQAVLMDQTMPRMDGTAAAAAILSLDPKARIILSSGFPSGEELLKSSTLRATAFLPKPYQIQDLVAVLHQVLETP